MMLLLEQTWLCPGTLDSGAHLTSNAVQCECGCRNLTPLARILDRTSPRELKPISSYVELVCAYVDSYVDERAFGIESYD
jgi:hypothetical protein